MRTPSSSRSITSAARSAASTTEVIYGDDQVKPDVGKQLADEMLKKHQVHFVSGIIWSNVMLAVAPTVTERGHVHDRHQRRPARARRQGLQRALLHHLVAERPDARGDGQVHAGPGHHRRLRDGAQLRRRQGHDHRLQALLQGQDRRRGLHQARPARLPGRDQPAAREEPEGGVRLLPGRHGHPVPQAVLRRPACAGRSRCTRSTRWTRSRSRRSKRRRARPVRDALLEPRPQERRPTRSTSRDFKKKYGKHAGRSTARRATTASC